MLDVLRRPSLFATVLGRHVTTRRCRTKKGAVEFEFDVPDNIHANDCLLVHATAAAPAATRPCGYSRRRGWGGCGGRRRRRYVAAAGSASSAVPMRKGRSKVSQPDGLSRPNLGRRVSDAALACGSSRSAVLDTLCRKIGGCTPDDGQGVLTSVLFTHWVLVNGEHLGTCLRARRLAWAGGLLVRCERLPCLGCSSCARVRGL